MGVIYKHTLLAECKHKDGCYIGLTCQDVENRWLNGKGYSGNRFFSNVINKYNGQSDFSHEIIETNIETIEEAKTREQYGITYYHSGINDPLCKGFNLTSGGDANNMSRKWFKDLDGNFVLGYKYGEELDLGYKCLNAEEYAEVAALRNKQYVEKNKEHIKEYKKQGTINNADKLKIKQQKYYQENKEIIKVERAEYFKAYNKEHNKNLTEEQRAKKNARNKQYRETHKEKVAETKKQGYLAHRQLTGIPPGKANCKKVRCIETGQIFDSAREASLFLKLNEHAVSCAISKHVKAGGYYGEYIEKNEI